MSSNEHVVQFYETETFLLDTLADFIGTGLRARDTSVVVAIGEHREALDNRLQAQGHDVASARACGDFITLDARDVLGNIMVDGSPDRARFGDIVGGVIAQATERRHHVRVYGELVTLLAAEGNSTAAVHLEEMWNDLQREFSFSLLCAYPLNLLDGDGPHNAFSDVCDVHSRVIPAESFTSLQTHHEQLRAISVLQQKATRLEAEIAQRNQAEEQLQVALEAECAARKDAEEALRWREEFISVAAHELKTPLTSLLGNAQMVPRMFAREAHVNPERVLHSMQAITVQAHKLSRLITQLLDVTRLKAERLSLERRTTDLSVLVAHIVDSAQVLSDRHTFNLNVPDVLEAQVDSLRLEQVLFNLLDNAVKYSPEGGAIDVGLTRSSFDLVELSVRDHGLGIPPDKRGQLFERFYQAHGAGIGSGMGLGLYISREIVHLHGGEIRAEFPEDGGARFIVSLPIKAVSPVSIMPDSRAEVIAMELSTDGSGQFGSD